MKNKFIVFEGIEACGKSTQIQLLRKYLESKGEKVWCTAEPSSGMIGKTLRYYLQHSSLDNKSMALLFAADRSLHVKEIQSHLDRGEWVICDRYILSNMAYQCYGNSEDLVTTINKDFIKPDYYVYLDISVDESLERICRRKGITECFDNREALIDISSRYKKFLDISSSSVIVVDGSADINTVQSSIINKLFQ